MLARSSHSEAPGAPWLARRLEEMARSRGSTRAGLCARVLAMVRVDGWKRLGFARAGDYAAERLGISGREVQDLAHVGERMEWFPGLEAALRSGRLPWTKVRLIARVATEETVQAWIDRAECHTCRELEHAVKRSPAPLADGSGGLLESGSARERVSVFCSGGTFGSWQAVRELASRVEGQDISAGEALEMISAETLSAMPLGVVPEETEECVCTPGAPRDFLPERQRVMPRPDPEADPWALDEQARALLAAERQLDAQTGTLLVLLRRRNLHRWLGFATFSDYTSERLGMSVRKAQTLIRIEEVALRSPDLEQVYRRGDLSWARAQAIIGLLERDTARRWHGRWVEHSLAVSVRRLRDDARRARVVLETDPSQWEASGGFEDEAAIGSGEEGGAKTRASEVGPSETFEITLMAPPESIALFWSVLERVQEHVEGETGRRPTQGEAFGIMLEHARQAWESERLTPASQHVFERDDWRCVVPGCTSRRNLQSHHVQFRSRGGGNEAANRVSLCAFHHQRAVHAGTVRIRGSAPDHLHFALGIRPNGPALAEFTSGDYYAAVRS